MPESALDVRQYVSFLMGAMSTKGNRMLTEYLKPFDLTVGCFYILSFISNQGNRMSQKQLAEYLCMNVNTVTRYLDEMEERGHAQRISNPENRKENKIELTEEGHRVVRAAHSKIDGLRKHIYKDITEREFHELQRILQKLFDSSTPLC